MPKKSVKAASEKPIKKSGRGRRPGKPAGKTANISELHRLTGLHRQTVSRRLEEAGIKPVSVKQKETTYNRAKALAVLRTQPSSEMKPTGITESRRKKIDAEAELKILELKKERAELVPIGEVRSQLFAVFKAMFERVAMQYPKEASGRLQKTKTRMEKQKMLQADLTLIFNELKRNYPKLL